MFAKAFWMLKWQGAESGKLACKRARGRKASFRFQGFDSRSGARLWAELKVGDVAFCYQTAGREVIGVARIVKKGGREGGRMHVDLKPIRCLKAPVKIQALKRHHKGLASIGCLKSGPFKAISRVWVSGARVLARFCDASRWVTCAKFKTRSATPTLVQQRSDAFRPQSNPVVTQDRALEDWVEMLLDKAYGDPLDAWDLATKLAHDLPASNEDRQRIEGAAELIVQRNPKLKSLTSNPAASNSASASDVPHVSECPCGGQNKYCYRCDGSGSL